MNLMSCIWLQINITIQSTIIQGSGEIQYLVLCGELYVVSSYLSICK